MKRSLTKGEIAALVIGVVVVLILIFTFATPYVEPVP
jgi:hypothetical protein